MTTITTTTAHITAPIHVATFQRTQLLARRGAAATAEATHALAELDELAMAPLRERAARDEAARRAAEHDRTQQLLQQMITRSYAAA